MKDDKEKKEGLKFRFPVMADVTVCLHCGKNAGTFAGVPPVCPHCGMPMSVGVVPFILSRMIRKGKKSK